MARYSMEDKKAIAKYQRQEVWGEDFITGERRLKGGGLNPANLQLLCPPCNKKKGNRVPKTIKKTVAKSPTQKASRSRKGKG